jgi:hypothetical protein
MCRGGRVVEGEELLRTTPLHYYYCIKINDINMIIISINNIGGTISERSTYIIYISHNILNPPPPEHLVEREHGGREVLKRVVLKCVCVCVCERERERER